MYCPRQFEPSNASSGGTFRTPRPASDRRVPPEESGLEDGTKWASFFSVSDERRAPPLRSRNQPTDTMFTVDTGDDTLCRPLILVKQERIEDRSPRVETFGLIGSGSNLQCVPTTCCCVARRSDGEWKALDDSESRRSVFSMEEQFANHTRVRTCVITAETGVRIINLELQATAHNRFDESRDRLGG